ncbi:MAG: hypothetical protein AB7V32_01100 [Candidatus Berkiella sp.]
MPRKVDNSQKIAQGLAYFLFYIPNGFILPLLSKADATYDLVHHQQVACAFCSYHRNVKRDLKSKLALKTKKMLKSWQDNLARFFKKIIQFQLSIINAMLPKRWIDILSNKLQELQKNLNPNFKRLSHFFDKHQSKIIFYGFLPIVALSGGVWIYGLGIIPEIYAFLVASFWGGKILNHTANLLVNQKNSNEFKAMVKFGKMITLKEDAPFSKATKQDFIYLAKRFFVEVTLINLIQKFPQFIGYCFQAFFSWLAFYVLVKTATNEAPSMIHKYEQRLNANRPEPLYFSHQLDNALWLISYQSFRVCASEQAHRKYRSLHEQTHLKSGTPQDKRKLSR